MNQPVAPDSSWKQRARRTVVGLWGMARQHPALVGLALATWIAILAQSVLGISPKDLKPNADAFYTAFFFGGLAAFLVTSLWKLIGTGWNAPQHIAEAVEFVLRWFCGLQIGLAFILVFPEALERGLAWVVAHPEKTFLSVLGLLGVAAIYQTVVAPAHNLQEDSKGKPSFREETLGQEPVFDPYRTAVHEAGHALFLALLPRLDSQCVLLIRNPQTLASMAAHQLGVVKLSFSREEVFNELGIKMRLRMVMAGVLAERQMLGHATLGGSGDHATWLALAHEYLSNGFEGPFFPVPADSDQRFMNMEFLRQFHLDMEQEVAAFLATNRDVLHDLASEAMRVQRLGPEQLKPFLDRVRVPSGWLLPVL